MQQSPFTSSLATAAGAGADWIAPCLPTTAQWDLLTNKGMGGAGLSEGEAKFVENSLLKHDCGPAYYCAWIEAGSGAGKDGRSVKEMDKVKLQRRILVVARFRMLLVSKSRVGGKTLVGGKTVEMAPHLFDLDTVDIMPNTKDALRIFVRSSQGTMVGAESSGKIKCVVLNCPGKSAAVLEAIVSCYARLTTGFTQVAEKHAFDLAIRVPPERFPEVSTPSTDSKGAKAFLNSYTAFCALRNEPVGPAVGRFIEALIDRNVSVFPVHRCPGIDQKSEFGLAIGGLLQPLNFTRYFRGLSARAIAVSKFEPGLAVRYSSSITKLELISIEGAVDWLGLARSIRLNTELQLQHFDISHNPLTNRDVLALGKALGEQTHGFHVLRMVECKLKPKDIEALYTTFLESFDVSLTLRELDLSDNMIGEEGTTVLESWLSLAGSHSQLRRLKLGNTGLILAILFRDRTSNVLSSLEHLEMIDLRGAEWTSESWGQLEVGVHLSKKLCHVVVRGAQGISHNEVRNLYDSLLRHDDFHRVELDISEISLIGLDEKSPGHVFAPLQGVKSPMTSYRLRTLDTSGCHLSAESLCFLLATLNENCMTITTLRVGGNLDMNKDPQACYKFMDALVRYLEMGSPLLHLGLRAIKGVQLRRSLSILFRYLAHDNALQELDVRDNACGDAAFFALTESLHKNKRLQSILVDNNDLSYNSLLGLQSALEMNSALCDLALHKSSDVAKIRERFRSSPGQAAALSSTMSAIQAQLRLNSGRLPPPAEHGEPLLDGDAWKLWADDETFAPPSIAAPVANLPSHFAAGVAASQEIGAQGERKRRSFGVHLDALPPGFSLVKDCVSYLDRNALDVEGIFRLSGSVTVIKDLRARIDNGEKVDLNSILDPHSISGLLKLWLRELPDPLLPVPLYDTYLAVERCSDKTAQRKMIQSLLQGTPEPQRGLVRAMFGLQLKVIANASVNKMSATNMSTVFAPNLLRSTEERLVADTPKVNGIWKQVLEFGEVVFSEPMREFVCVARAKSGVPQGSWKVVPGDLVFLSNEHGKGVSMMAATGATEIADPMHFELVFRFDHGDENKPVGGAEGSSSAAQSNTNTWGRTSSGTRRSGNISLGTARGQQLQEEVPVTAPTQLAAPAASRRKGTLEALSEREAVVEARAAALRQKMEEKRRAKLERSASKIVPTESPPSPSLKISGELSTNDSFIIEEPEDSPTEAVRVTVDPRGKVRGMSISVNPPNRPLPKPPAKRTPGTEEAATPVVRPAVPSTPAPAPPSSASSTPTMMKAPSSPAPAPPATAAPVAPGSAASGMPADISLEEIGREITDEEMDVFHPDKPMPRRVSNHLKALFRKARIKKEEAEQPAMRRKIYDMMIDARKRAGRPVV